MKITIVGLSLLGAAAAANCRPRSNDTLTSTSLLTSTSVSVLSSASISVSVSSYANSSATSTSSAAASTTTAAAVSLLEVLGDLSTATTCDDCQAVMALIQEVANEGDAAYAALATYFCEAEGNDAEVCEGFMALETPSMAYSLRSMIIPSRTSQLWCYEVFGLCSVPAVLNQTVTFPKTKPNTTRPVASGATPVKVIHISDIHVDLNYTVGASYECDLAICCYPYSSDLAVNVTDYPAGPWGNHNCDSPLSLSESMYEAIKAAVPDAEFTLFTGDLVEGRQWATTHTEITNDVNSAYEHMSAYNLDTVYATVGNHESSPVNSFPQSGLSDVPSSESNRYLYDTLATNWGQWLGSTAASASKDLAGAYSVQHSSNLVIISINTMFYMVENWWLYTPTMETDPNAQFAWLIDELQAAEDAGSRAYIIGHVPFGRGDVFYDYSAYFDQILQRYDTTIAALFFGHTHRDMWELSYSDWSDKSAATANAVHYIAPAMTPTSGNPSFRVYDVDPETWAVLDYTVYVANMSAPDYQTTGPVWEEYYSVKSAYGALLDTPYTDASLELTPAFWHNVTGLFEDDDAVFQAYYARKQRGYDYSACTGSCKTTEVCQMRSSQSQYACLTSSSVSFKRDESFVSGTDSHGHGHGHGHSETGECPGSLAKKILAKIPQNLELLREALCELKRRK